MGWQKVAELRYGVDETRPGFEEEREDKRFFGEDIRVAIDPDWPAFPRIELRESGVISTTVKCALESGVELEIVENTGEETISMPPVNKAYLRLNSGSGFDAVYLYLHVSLTGGIVYVDYEYYPEDDTWVYLAFNDGRLCVASGAGRFYRLSDTSERIYDMPGKPISLTRDAAWAGGRSLYHYGKEHRPAIRRIGYDESTRALAASIAVTFGADLCYTPDRTLSLLNRRTEKIIKVPAEKVLNIKISQYAAYGAVRVVFDGGAVVAGTGSEMHVNLPTVSDVGIAKSTAERIRTAVLRDYAKYGISLMGDYEGFTGDVLSVLGMIRGTILTSKRYLDKERTDFEIIIQKKGANAIDQSK